MNRKLLAAAVAGAIAPMTAQAVDISVSGHVNRMVRYADNGNASDIQHLDHTASRSRWTIKGEGDLGNGITAGALLQQGFASNRGGSADVDKADTGPGEDFRHSYLYFSGDFGKVTLGHTGPAGNGAMFTAYNGAYAGTEYGVDSNSGISVSGSDDKTVGSFFPTVGIGRQNTLRYDTPPVGPVSAAVSVQKEGDAEGQNWTFQGNLSSELGGSSVKGSTFIAEDVIGVAGGLSFPQGTSINVAWGDDDRKGEDYNDIYVSLAHSWGNTSVAIGYRSTDNKGKKLEGQAIGLGVSHSLGSGVNVYAGFNNYSFDDNTDADLDDVNAFHIGSLVSFN